jgi:hypothetical protein
VLTTIFGLPTHILVIHGIVVGIPLAALVSMLVAVRKRWRDRFGWWVLAFDVLVVLGTWLARETGINLFNHLPAVVQQTAANHRALGLNLIWFVLAMLVAVAALMAADRLGNRVLSSGLAVVVLATAVLAIIRVIQTGDAGAHAVWNGVVH